MKEITFDYLKSWKVDHKIFSEIYKKPVCITGRITIITDSELIEDMNWAKERNLNDVMTYALYDEHDFKKNFPVFLGDSIDCHFDFKDGMLIKIYGEFGGLSTTKTCIGKITSVEIIENEDKE